MRRLLLLALLLVSAARTGLTAPITATLGAGGALVDDSYGDHPIVLALDGLVAYRLNAHWAVGARFGVATAVHAQTVTVGGGGDYDLIDYYIHPLDVGATVQYSSDRFWIAPWIAEHWSFGTYQETGSALGCPIQGSGSFFHRDFPAVGSTVGIDLERGPNKLSIYTDFELGLGRQLGNDPDRYSDITVTNWAALTVGMAYRR